MVDLRRRTLALVGGEVQGYWLTGELVDTVGSDDELAAEDAKLSSEDFRPLREKRPALTILMFV